jgi:hypothetical protein
MSVFTSAAPPAYSPQHLFDLLRVRFRRLAGDRARLLGLVLLGALIAFELFNYSTTEFALSDLLGGMSLGSLRWATILALAFAAMDFAGIAWLFTPRPQDRGLHSWYLIGAWFLAATMNATLTWWSVSLALVSHPSIGGLLIGQQAMLRGVPAFVAALVWLLRILLIGSFSLRVPGPAASPRLARLSPQAPVQPVRLQARRRPGPSVGGRVPARLIRRGRAPIGQSVHELYAPRAHPR